MKLALTLAIVLSTSSMALADSFLSVDQDDAIANLALESASTVCSSADLSNFITTAQGRFTAKINSKSLPSGLKSLAIVLESASQQLVVVKPYVLLSPALNAAPICTLSTKDLSSPN